MKNSILTLALAGLVGAAFTAGAQKPQTVTDTTVAKVKVLDVNAAKRQVTLKEENGDVDTVFVPENYDLAKVKAGDTLTLTLAEKLTVALAKPGEGDSAAIKQVTAGGSAEVTRVVTITALDMSVPSVTFKNAEGKSRTVKIRDAKNAEGYKVGDKVTITYTASLSAAVAK